MSVYVPVLVTVLALLGVVLAAYFALRRAADRYESEHHRRGHGRRGHAHRRR